MLIEVSGQYGDPKVSKLFWPLQKKINECFDRCVGGEYFKSLSKIAVGLRVSGEIWKFSPEGPGKLRYNRKSNIITIDLVFLESQWKGVDLDKIVKEIEVGMRQCFGLVIEKSKSVGELKDESGFFEDVELALMEFLKCDGF